jgi:transposase
MSEDLKPKNHAETVALFRAQILGPVLARQLDRGELKEEFKALSAYRWLPPGQVQFRQYSAATLERWYYRYRKRGLAGLKPHPRRSGFAQRLTEVQRMLICDIAEAYPRAPVSVIVRTLEADGRLEAGAASHNTVRRLLVEKGLWCTPSPTTPRRAARWSASGARCGSSASTTARASARCTTCRCGCSRGSTTATSSRRTAGSSGARPPRPTPMASGERPSPNPCCAKHSSCGRGVACSATAPCPSRAPTSSWTRATSRAAT